MTTSTTDVLIVGDGALGLFLAWELVEHGEGSVTIVAPGHRHGGASRASGAMLGCFGEISKDTLRTDAGRAKFEIGLGAHRMWPDVLAALAELASDLPLHTVSDTHVLLNACGGELDSLNFHAMIDALEEYDEPWEEIDAHDIPGYNPRTDARALRAIRLSGEGAVHSGHVLAVLDRHLADRGVTRVTASVDAIATEGNRVTGVALDNGDRISAGTVVVAAGAASGELLRTALPRHEIMPTFAGFGVAMIGRREFGERFTSVVRSPNRSGACGLHVVPLGDGLEYIGATNFVFAKPRYEANFGVAKFIAECAMQQLDEQTCFHSITEVRTGNRPVTLDGFPLVGWSTVDGLYVMTGTYRDGFHSAPALARHVALELRGEPGIIDPMFRPDRAPLSTRTVEEAIDECVLHMAAGWFEARAIAPPEVSSAMLDRMFRAQAESVYEAIPRVMGLGPDLMIYLSGPHADESRYAEIMRYLRRVSA